jgi:putative ATPase
MQCLPDSLKDREYYHPTTQGDEVSVAKRLDEIKEWKKL